MSHTQKNQTSLHMTIGPVQGFVSQSRRTRDLWSSSFLLSYLAGSGMVKLEQLGADIILPNVTDDLLFCKIKDPHSPGTPSIGSLPNRFQASFPAGTSNDEIQQAAQVTRKAILTAWQKMADDIWDTYVKKAVESGNKTEAIWDRQVKDFWDIQWVIGADPTLLDRRKNWRIHLPPEEPGDKCTLMQDWQELSGHIRSQGANTRKQQDHFWEMIQEQISCLDLGDEEKLCAPALIKRLFPKRSHETIGWDVQSSSWPSTSYIAAIPWIVEVMKHRPTEADQYAQALIVQIEDGILTEKRNNIRSLQAWPDARFSAIDGKLFFSNALENERLVLLKEEHQRSRVIEQLQALYKLKKNDTQEPLGPPSPYYALLLMDGDSLGGLNRDLGIKVSEALAFFTNQVKQTVREHDGVVIYAGGDDLLAMLPLPLAFRCASTVSQLYKKAFQDVLGEAYPAYQERTTISAGLVFAHAQAPLHTMLHEAHSLLDDIAKDLCGRDSIAVRVWRPSGKMCEYSCTWKHFQDIQPTTLSGQELLWENSPPTNRLEQMAALFRNRERGQKGGFSSSFVYRLRDQIGLLCGWPHWTPGVFGDVNQIKESLDLKKFLAAEYIRCLRIAGWTEEEIQREEAMQHMDILLQTSFRASRSQENEQFHHHVDPRRIGLDAVLLARFLAQGGDTSNK